MQFHAEGFDLVPTGKWRQFDGMVGAVLEVDGKKGAQGYFRYDDPRIVIHFDKVSNWKSVSVDSTAPCRRRPVLQAAYIPAGVPWWITGDANRSFSHLNIYMHKDRLTRYLSPGLGKSAALAAINRPIELDEPGSLMTLAKLLSDEISMPTHHSLHAENLIGSIITGLLHITAPEADASPRKLTSGQLDKIFACFEAGRTQRVPVAEMASIVGLSESWFSQLFKNTTGTRPLEWQRIRKIDDVKTMLRDTDLPLAEIAYELGFTDQSHMTKAFKQLVGMGPAAWRLSQK